MCLSYILLCLNALFYLCSLLRPYPWQLRGWTRLWQWSSAWPSPSGGSLPWWTAPSPGSRCPPCIWRVLFSMQDDKSDICTAHSDDLYWLLSPSARYDHLSLLGALSFVSTVQRWRQNKIRVNIFMYDTKLHFFFIIINAKRLLASWMINNL